MLNKTPQQNQQLIRQAMGPGYQVGLAGERWLPLLDPAKKATPLGQSHRGRKAPQSGRRLAKSSAGRR